VTADAIATSAMRVVDRLEDLFSLGAPPHARRPGLGIEEEAACRLAAGWMADSGLEVFWDLAGNVVGRVRGQEPDLPEVWTGSHLDTVPAGGRFDGALGVVAGIEAVTGLTGRALRRTWRDCRRARAQSATPPRRGTPPLRPCGATHGR